MNYVMLPSSLSHSPNSIGFAARTHTPSMRLSRYDFQFKFTYTKENHFDFEWKAYEWRTLSAAHIHTNWLLSQHALVNDGGSRKW